MIRPPEEFLEQLYGRLCVFDEDTFLNTVILSTLFSEHVSGLETEEQLAFKGYQIQLSLLKKGVIGNDCHSSTVGQLINELDQGPFKNMTKLYLWKFLLDFNKDAEVPADVVEFAKKQGYRLDCKVKPKTANFSMFGKLSKPKKPPKKGPSNRVFPSMRRGRQQHLKTD